MTTKRGHGEGTIRLRDDGRWEAMVTIDYGKRKSVYGKTRREVQQKLQQLRHDLERGIHPADGRQTVSQYLAHWLNTILPTENLDVGTVHRHREYVQLHIVPALGHIPLAKLSQTQVQAFYADKLKALSPTTVNHLHGSLHKALEAAVRADLVARNVCKLVSVPHAKPEEMRPLARDEARILMDATKGTRLEALFALALATGMRQGELLALKWRDVDLEGSTLSVRATLKRNRETHEWYFKEPKTKRSRRQIALSDAVVEALHAHHAHHARQAAERLLVGAAWEDNGLVFCTAVGGILSARDVARRFKAALKRGHLPDVRFHDLRHTCATLLLLARVNPKVVSELLGHASVAITLDIYSHVLPEMQQDAAATMCTLLFG